jgi:predicted MPP superfamily phosphohydrolase
VFLIADLIATILFIALQWRISVELLAVARRRLPGPLFQAVRIAVLVFNAALAAGYLLSDTELAAQCGFPPRPAAFLGAGALIYLAIAFGVLLLHSLFRSLDRRMAPKFDPGRRQALRAASHVAMALPAAAVGYGAFIERLDLRVREIDVPLPGLPRDLEGFRILQISDIHLSAFLSEKQLSRVIDAALEFRPHLAAVTGDLISAEGDPLDACIRQVARLRADAGIFGCMGNHEIYAKAEEYAEKAGARAGIRFLRGRAIPLRFGSSMVNLAGVDYQRRADKDRYLRGAERLVMPGAINVLMSHNPDVFPVAANQGYNLLLAGHTHGGQVTVEILEQSINPARFFTPYVYGLYRAGGAAAYVTRGIGTIGIPVRIGAPPEIVLLRFRKA